MQLRSSRGFTLIELLIVVAVIGILTAVAIPTLLNAVDRGRQKRTMADLHTIATAIQAYTIDFNHCPLAADISSLAAELNGDYAKRLPTHDGWAHAFVYTGTAAAGYTVGSVGKDGGNTLSLEGSGGPTSELDADIIYSNGQFLQWPEGAQTE
jgi:general secretion pathway protein G